MESVWDYPRPPRLEPTGDRIRVVHEGAEIASTTRALRLLETSHPPTYYIPMAYVRTEFLVPGITRSVCEWKGVASYYDLRIGGTVVTDVAWTYPHPRSPFEQLAHHIAFYAGKVDACYVGNERVDAQVGNFYGGWITSGIQGPFKGPSGTSGW